MGDGINKLFSLEGKIALVTGAVGLIGKEHCRALSEAGARVIAGDVSDAVEELAAEVGSDSVEGYFLDVTSPESVTKVRDYMLSKYGKLDVLVNNAAINDMFENPASALEQSKFENYPLEMWKKSLEVNVTGTFLCSQILGAEMA